MQGTLIAQVLKTLNPTTQEEVSTLRQVIFFAQMMLRGHAKADWSSSSALREEKDPVDLTTFLKSVPEDARRYFHGLVEAIEIYQSIKGRQLPVQSLSPAQATASWVYELKQIRDMCLEEGLRSIY